MKIEHISAEYRTDDGVSSVLNDISFSLNKGETLGLVGETGAGKTTTALAIMRLLPKRTGFITGGSIEFAKDGNILEKSEAQMRAIRGHRISMIFQDPYASLNPRLSVSEIIREPMEVGKMYKTKSEVHARVKELMEVVGLAPRLINSYPHELDGGRRQRIGIARALATNPEFIVCDEPVSALDVSIQAQILNLMMDLQEERQLAYMFITHDMSVVKHISTEIAVMYLGQCVELAPTDELFESPQHPYTKALLSAIPVIDITKLDAEPELLKGEVTSPINPVSYCRFFPRCPFACDGCKEAPYELAKTGENHYSACILNREGK